MMLYLLKSTLCLALIYLIYQFLLERERMPWLKRWYLLFGLLFSFLVPFAHTGWNVSLLEEQQLLETVTTLNIQKGSSGEVGAENDFWSTVYYCLQWLYWCVTGVLLLRLVLQLRSLFNSIVKHKIVHYKNVRYVLLSQRVIPHTFLNFIFVNQEEYQSDRIEEKLLLHETTHATQLHSLDILLVELLRVFFWFNPMLLLYKRAIQLNHEFLADDVVLASQKDVKSYQNLLMDTISTNNNQPLVSNLNFMITKKRLKMMTRKTSRMKAISFSVLTIPLFAGLFFLFGNTAVAQKATDIEALKESYFKHATFVCDEDADKKVYKTYKVMTSKEKAKIPLPPPRKDGKARKPLPKGTLVYLRADGKVLVDNSGTAVPPPPPAPPKLKKN